MEFQVVVNRRQMVRRFIDRKIPDVLVEQILANMFKGPSAGFSQGTEVLVIQGGQREKVYSLWGSKEDRRRSYPLSEGIEKAPLLLAVFVSKKKYEERYRMSDKQRYSQDDTWPAPFWFIDGGMAVLLALLSAIDQGLGALFTGIKDPAELRRRFSVPEEFIPLGVISIGYADHTYRSKPRVPRRPLSEVIHRGRWGE